MSKIDDLPQLEHKVSLLLFLALIFILFRYQQQKRCSHLFTYDYPRLLVFTSFLQFTLVFICVYHCLLVHVYQSWPMYTRVYLCYVYNCLLVFNYDYSCWRMFNTRPCLPKFNHVYTCFSIFTLVNQNLPLFTRVRLCFILPMITCVYLSLHMFTYDYYYICNYLPMFTHVY